MYSAIRSTGFNLDFELRKHRDYAAAYHFLKRLLTTNGRPERLVTDQYRATLKAVKQLVKIELSEVSQLTSTPNIETV